MQIRIRATSWAIIDSTRPSSGPEGGGCWGREGRGAGARGADIAGGLEDRWLGARDAPSLGSRLPQLGCSPGKTAGPWFVASVGSWETESKGLWGPGTSGVGVGVNGDMGCVHLRVKNVEGSPLP